jgi:hypothetical protein
MKPIVFILILLLSNALMAQSISFTGHGLNTVFLGEKVHYASVKRIKVHPQKHQFRLWFEGVFEYYYFEQELLLQGMYRVAHLFIAANRQEEVTSIIIYVQDSLPSVIDDIIKVFGNPSTKSNSSIDGMQTNLKHFWKTSTGVSVLYTTYQGINLCKIEIYNTPIEEETPGVTISVE